MAWFIHGTGGMGVRSLVPKVQKQQGQDQLAWKRGTSKATVRSPWCGPRSQGRTALTRGAEQGPTELQEGGGKLHGRLGSVDAPRTKVALPRAWPWASCTPSSPLSRTRALLPPPEKCTVCSDNRQSPGQLPAQASGS